MKYKYPNITVSTSLSTDFFFEVNEDTTEEEIKKIVRQNIEKELESFMSKWNVDELEIIIE